MPDSRTRLLGLDVARFLALVGMVCVHVLPADADGALGTLHDLAAGRASALFAVLAGVGLALASGGPRPVRGEHLRTARRGTVVRGLLVIGIGLVVGLVTTPAAVILAYYGVLFVLAAPVLGLRWPALAALAATAAVFTPLLSQQLRAAGLDEVIYANPTPLELAEPLRLLQTLLLTGYYPVLTWTTYLLAGLAVGRLALRGPATAPVVTAVGAALAVAASTVSVAAVRAAGGVGGLTERLADGGPETAAIGGRGPDLLDGSFYGVTPVPDPIWLLIRAPHSGSITDLVHTTGVALAVIGVMLLVAPRLGRAARWPAAAGACTLTLYTLHVLSLNLLATDDPTASALAVLGTVLAAVAFALAVGAPDRRGPLESLVAAVVARARGREERRSAPR